MQTSYKHDWTLLRRNIRKDKQHSREAMRHQVHLFPIQRILIVILQCNRMTLQIVPEKMKLLKNSPSSVRMHCLLLECWRSDCQRQVIHESKLIMRFAYLLLCDNSTKMRHQRSSLSLIQNCVKTLDYKLPSVLKMYFNTCYNLLYYTVFKPIKSCHRRRT